MLEGLNDRYVDAIRLAKTGQRLTGEIGLARMTRLGPSLASRAGAATVTLQFGVDAQGIGFVRGHVNSRLEVICQRCLKPMVLDVEAVVSLGIVASPEAARELPEEYEPLLVGEDPVSIAAVVEDELILALPIVTLHPPGVCTAAVASSGDGAAATDEPEPRKTRPFAVLEKMKVRR